MHSGRAAVVEAAVAAVVVVVVVADAVPWEQSAAAVVSA
jgi:hypothetical protein